jgi:hypothetical protein
LVSRDAIRVTESEQILGQNELLWYFHVLFIKSFPSRLKTKLPLLVLVPLRRLSENYNRRRLGTVTRKPVSDSKILSHTSHKTDGSCHTLEDHHRRICSVLSSIPAESRTRLKHIAHSGPGCPVDTGTKLFSVQSPP